MRVSTYVLSSIVVSGWVHAACAADVPIDYPTRPALRGPRNEAADALDSNRSPAPPPEAFEACRNRSEGDACTVAFHDQTLEGTCRRMPDNDGELVCIPARMPPPPDR